jgi:hypothetical protein
MLRLELTVQNHKLIPTSYILQGVDKYEIIKKKFYNLSYTHTNFTRGWEKCYMYYARKLNIGRSENGDIRTVLAGRGGEFYNGQNLFTDGISKRDPQYMCHNSRLLILVLQANPGNLYTFKKGIGFIFNNPKPCSFKRNGLFSYNMGDLTTTTLANNDGRKIVLHFSIFDEDTE